MLELAADCFNAISICTHIAITEAGGGSHVGGIARRIVQKLYIINIAHKPASELRIKVIIRLLDDIGFIHCEEYLLNLGQVRVQGGD